MSIDEKFEEFKKAKDEEILKLNKMKDALKSKLDELKKENEELKKQIEELKKGTQIQTEKPPISKPVSTTPNLDQSQEINKLNELIKKKDEEINSLKQKIDELKISTPSLQNEEFEPKIINAKIGAIQSKLDKSFDIVFEKLNDLLKMISDISFKESKQPTTPTAAITTTSTPIKKEEPIKTTQISTANPVASQPIQPQTSKSTSEIKPSTPTSITDIFKQQILEQQKKNVELDLTPDTELKKKQMVEPHIDKTQPKTDSKTFTQTQESSEGLLMVDYPSSGTIKCPKCGKQNYQEMENRAQILSYIPKPKYGKKYYCKSCRCEWAYKI